MPLFPRLLCVFYVFSIKMWWKSHKSSRRKERRRDMLVVDVFIFIVFFLVIVWLFYGSHIFLFISNLLFSPDAKRVNVCSEPNTKDFMAIKIQLFDVVISCKRSDFRFGYRLLIVTFVLLLFYTFFEFELRLVLWCIVYPGDLD